MPIKHTVTRTYKGQSATSVTCKEEIEGAVEQNLTKTLAAGTNVLVAFAIIQANMLCMSIYASTACTIKTNSSGSPQDTISLAAGENLLWTAAKDGLPSCPFSDDVTALYVTNAASVDLQIQTLSS